MTALPVYVVNHMDTVGAYDWYTYDTEHDACVAARRLARDASIAYVEVLAVTADLAAVCLYDIIATDAVRLVEQVTPS